MFQVSINSVLGTFNFGTKLGLPDDKYFIKVIFDIILETGIFEITNVPNSNKF